MLKKILHNLDGSENTKFCIDDWCSNKLTYSKNLKKLTFFFPPKCTVEPKSPYGHRITYASMFQ